MLFSSTSSLKFNDRNLIPAIIQDHENGKVLMHVYMNRDAVKRSRKSGELWIYHRKKKKTWKKGNNSGRTFKVVDMFLHHDRNILLVSGVPNGPACHTGNETCFYHSYKNDPKGLPDDSISNDGEIDNIKKIFREDNLVSEVEIVGASESIVDQSEKLTIEDFKKNKPSEAEYEKKDDELTVKKLYQSIPKDSDSGKETNSGGSISEEIAQKIGQDSMQLAICTAHGDKDAIVQKSAEIVYQIIKLNAINQVNLISFEDNLKAVFDED